MARRKGSPNKKIRSDAGQKKYGGKIKVKAPKVKIKKKIFKPRSR